MTREEAIQWIQLDIDMAKFDPTTGENAYLNDDVKNAIEAQELAISALKAQMDGDTISRHAAIDAMCLACGQDCDKSRFVYNAPQDEQVIICPEHYALSTLPSAQPEPCKDAVSREAVSEWLKQYGQDVLHGKYKFSLVYIWKNLMDLPSAQLDLSGYSDRLWRNAYERGKRDAMAEIVHCKDCKHRYVDGDNVRFNVCELNHNKVQSDEWYCADAERRTDGTD